MFKKEILIKKFSHKYGDSVVYLINTILIILKNYKTIDIYITKHENKTQLEKELEVLTNE